MLMIFFFIMPGVMSGLGNLLVPIQMCVPELMFPKVNNLGMQIHLRVQDTTSTGDIALCATAPSVGIPLPVS